MNIKVDGTSTARVKITIEGQDKIALIDTGAGRCCMNEEHYQTLGSPPLEPTEADFKLRTASGALMPGMCRYRLSCSNGFKCYTRFWASWSSLGITNGNRSHNKPLELI